MNPINQNNQLNTYRYLDLFLQTTCQSLQLKKTHQEVKNSKAPIIRVDYSKNSYEREKMVNVVLIIYPYRKII